jgi:hypothetical protein
MTNKLTEFDIRAAAWVRRKFPEACPVVGTVTFYNDCACYATGGWANVEVSWYELSKDTSYAITVTRDLTSLSDEDSGGDFDWTRVIRELVDEDERDSSDRGTEESQDGDNSP